MLNACRQSAGGDPSNARSFLDVSVCAHLFSVGATRRKPGEFTVDGRAICVANVDGVISVLYGVCPHEEGPLGEGSIADGRVVCPWHGYSYDPKTGISPEDPDLKAQVYESVIENGDLRAKIG